MSIKIINSFILRTIRVILLKRRYYGIDEYSQPSFSQMGEDRILTVIFNNKRKGFYVDVGAHHPKLYSNTYLFYLQGWHGINIDAMPGSMNGFNKLRPRDINLEIAIGRKKQEKTYFLFSNSAVNTFSKKLAQKVKKTTKHKFLGTKKLYTSPLSSVLDKYLPSGQIIDFLSVDVEGMDYEVLISNNWTKYRPSVIVVEDLTFSMMNPRRSKIYVFLTKIKYELVAKNDVSLIFKES